MSFILDALKKSDGKRQTNTAPRLDTVHDSAPSQKRKSKWPLLICLGLLILLLNAGFLFWFAKPDQEQPAEKQLMTQKQVTPVTERLKVERATPVAARAEKSQAKISLPMPVKEQAVELSAGQSSTSVVPAAENTAGRTYALKELPGSIRGSLPEMHMSLHAFSQEDAAASLVRINNRIMREGEKLAGKYLLEEINAEGAVFSYQGYRFVLPRKSN